MDEGWVGSFIQRMFRTSFMDGMVPPLQAEVLHLIPHSCGHENCFFLQQQGPAVLCTFPTSLLSRARRRPMQEGLLSTLLQRRTQVRFWIQFKIPTEYDKLMPRLPENAKIKIPQVGTYFTL